MLSSPRSDRRARKGIICILSAATLAAGGVNKSSAGAAPDAAVETLAVRASSRARSEAGLSTNARKAWCWQPFSSDTPSLLGITGSKFRLSVLNLVIALESHGTNVAHQKPLTKFRSSSSPNFCSQLDDFSSPAKTVLPWLIGNMEVAFRSTSRHQVDASGCFARTKSHMPKSFRCHERYAIETHQRHARSLQPSKCKAAHSWPVPYSLKQGTTKLS